jgi:hypothetical protein
MNGTENGAPSTMQKPKGNWSQYSIQQGEEKEDMTALFHTVAEEIALMWYIFARIDMD